MKKHFLRKKILIKRNSQAELLKQKKDVAILMRLERFSIFKNAAEIFTYVSHRGEVSTTELLKKYFKKKKIIVPKVESRQIGLFELVALNDLRKGKFGILEPKKSLPKKNWSEINLAIIPGIAFDKTGHRIGYGGGYFDRLLKKLHCTTIGLAYEFQIIDKVPTHQYDVPVDFIITEKRIIRCQLLRNKIRRSTKSSQRKRSARERG